jgi:hypothetical protein
VTLFFFWPLIEYDRTLSVRPDDAAHCQLKEPIDDQVENRTSESKVEHLMDCEHLPVGPLMPLTALAGRGASND